LGIEPGPVQELAPKARPFRPFRRARPWLLPFVLFLAGLTASMALAMSFRNFERRHLAFIAEAEVNRVGADLQREMRSRLEGFARIAQRYPQTLRDQKGPWHIELGGLVASLWVEPSGRVTRVTPLEGNEDLADRDLAATPADRDAFLKAQATGHPITTTSTVVPGGDSSFHFIVPISDRGVLQGFVVGVFSGKALYPATLHAETPSGWAVAVYEGPRLLYQTAVPVDERGRAEVKVPVMGTDRVVRTSPGPEVLARLHSPLPGIALAGGSVIALLLAATTYLAQSARHRERDAAAANAAFRASERRTQAILDAALDAVITMDAHGLVMSWNARAENLFGFAPAEAVGRELADLIIPLRYRDAHRRGLAHFLATGEGPVIGRRVELSALRRDGSEFPVELTVTALREGPVEFFSAFLADLTERRRALQRLSAQHEATRTLSEAATLAEAAPKMLAAVGAALGWDVGALWTVDRQAQTMRCRTFWRASADGTSKFEALSRMLGLPPGGGLPGRVWESGEPIWMLDVGADPTLPRLEVARGEGLRSGFAFPIHFEGAVVGVVEFLSRESRERDDDLLRILADLESQVAHFWQRRRAEKAMRAAQERLGHVLASSPAVLYTLKVAGDRLLPAWVSQNMERLSGYAASEVSGPDWWSERIHPDDRERVLAENATLLTRGYVAREYRFRHKRGDYRWVHNENVLIRNAAGEPVEVVGSWSDVTALKQTELKLEASEEQYRLLFDRNPQPMWVYDDETRHFLAVNDAAVAHYGYSRDEFLAMTLRDIRPPEEVPILDEFAAARRQSRPGAAFRSDRVWKHRKKDGTLMDVKIAVSPIPFTGRAASLVLATDVTEEKRLEAQLRQSQKMESVGRLAGGVAHDFNNLLGVITGYGELLQREIGPGHPAFGRVTEIRKAAERAAGLTRQLLAFSRKQVLEPKVLDLNVVVSETEKMLRRLIGEDIQLITVFDEALGLVKADPGQIEQVIVNLVVNARDAMPEGGKLIVETANVDLDESYTRSRPDAVAGRHVMVAVSDTGHGMDAQVLSHLFEPFFTTKGPGKGTGLGLATVHGIVRQSGGHVSAYSEIGRGTTFKVYLPRRDEPQEAASEAVETSAPASLGSETILLVEDEPSLRVMISEILEAAGYEVLEGPTPEEALAAAGAHGGPIALMLTDVILPRMSGVQVAEALRSSRPETRVLFMSGYTDDAIGHHGILQAGTQFLQKPFTTESLLHKVRDILDTARSGAPPP
jgi:two-component system cell cycle sensor histidine kinase/response regulator CckA